MANDWRDDEYLATFFEDNELKDYEIFMGGSYPDEPVVDFVAKFNGKEVSRKDIYYYLALKNAEKFIDEAYSKLSEIDYEVLISQVMDKIHRELITRYELSMNDND